MSLRTGTFILAALFIVSGVLHLTAPRIYLDVMPPYLPHPLALVYISGIAEIAGGIGILIPRVRMAAGLGLIVMLFAILPANVQMLINYRARGVVWWGEMLLWLRLPLQFVLMGWVWHSTRRAS